LSQDKRIGQLSTPLGKDVLVLVRFDGTEGLSELFEFRVEALSERADIDFDEVIGQQCSLKFATYGQQREFNGILVEAQWLGVSSDHYSYRIILRPWLWLLSHTTDCRIFSNKKVPDIIKEVFQDRGFTDFEFHLSDEGSYPQWEYCVQYRETDLNFVTRLMEKEGIYYFFRHDGGKHTLILADSKSAHQPVPGRMKTPFIPVATGPGTARPQKHHIYEWVSERRFQTGKVELKDYNYQKPNVQMLSDAKASERYTHSDLELYDYPGNYKEQSVGERYAKIQLESEQARDHRRHGNGDAMSLFPGGLTTLEKHPSDAQNVEYLTVRAAHSFVDEMYRTGGHKPATETYYGSYEFLPSDRRFRAPIVTPKPRIYGIQTAKVVTKNDGSSEEIDVEGLSEIYVRFHWDRKKKRSCKLRVAQVWSGKGWGGQFIPRVGMEVVVEFLEGDPDRPLVVGTVYNEECKPPYPLPGNKTMAGTKSNSTPGGGGFNEFVFEDKKSSENIRMHAQKDYNVTIEHDMCQHVFNDRSRDVKQNETVKIGANQTLTIDGHRTETVNSGETVTVNGGRTHTVNGVQSTTISLAETHTVGAARMHTVGAAEAITVGAAQIITIGAAQTISVGSNQTTSVGSNQTISVASNQTNSVGKERSTSIGQNETLDVGKTISNSAGDQIVLKTGSATIMMKKNGDINIEGKTITIKGSGDVIIKGQKILQN
jgi:type VI secretion system secreted protein VgrG